MEQQQWKGKFVSSKYSILTNVGGTIEAILPKGIDFGIRICEFNVEFEYDALYNLYGYVMTRLSGKKDTSNVSFNILSDSIVDEYTNYKVTKMTKDVIEGTYATNPRRFTIGTISKHNPQPPRFEIALTHNPNDYGTFCLNKIE